MANENIKDLFKDVYGYENNIKEISAILSSFLGNKLSNKGILLYGPPGNGKSLIISKIKESNLFNCYIFAGKEEEVAKEFDEFYGKIKKEVEENKNNVNKKPTIIILDEIDNLLEKDYHFERILKTKMDGVEKVNDDILFIGATNTVLSIDRSFLRGKRFDKVIYFPYLDQNQLFSYFLAKLKENNIKLEKGIENDHLEYFLINKSLSDIHALVSSICLHCKFKNELNKYDLVDQFILFFDRAKADEKTRIKEICYHEAAHALMCEKYSDFFYAYFLEMNDNGGKCHYYDKKSDYQTYSYGIAEIDISYAGPAFERILSKECSAGDESDLNSARARANNLVNRLGYKHFYKTLGEAGNDRARQPTLFKARKNEKYVEKLLKSREKKVYKYLKKNKDKVIKLGDELYKRGYLIRCDIDRILSC